jgi:hypothetical protein
VVDAGEELAHVALEHVGMPPGEVLRPIQRGVSALALAVGVGIVDEARLENGADDVDQGVREPRSAMISARVLA